MMIPSTRARSSITLLVLASCLGVTACASVTIRVPDSSVDTTKRKNIFVFFDGTDNVAASKTNVWRLFSVIKQSDREATLMYVDGVGTTASGNLGSAFGLGMQRRILKGYRFITEHYAAGDSIFIFGFSRGAHQARSLAGLLSYAGVPMRDSRGEVPSKRTMKRILEITKDQRDDATVWDPNRPPLAHLLSVETQPVTIAFLGLWDTVPGSSFKEFEGCLEKRGPFKELGLAPAKGDRYKLGSYPPIKRIAHAVAADEKRSMFKPVLVCDRPGRKGDRTGIHEMWFPGAHADVGGGYEDCQLAGISLNWMIDQLAEIYPFPGGVPRFDANPKGVAHWSVADFPANFRSTCEDRHELEGPPEGEPHPSWDARRASAPVPLKISGTTYELPYPIGCDPLGKSGHDSPSTLPDAARSTTTDKKCCPCPTSGCP